MATTKIREKNNPTMGKNLLTTIFKRTIGIYTHIDDVVSRDKQGICDLALLPPHVTWAVTQEKHLR